MANDLVTSSSLPEDKASIHFDTLMREAHDVLEKASGLLWTDRSIHDPGITLLESLAWNISDIGYRSLLPVRDLLTPRENQPGDNLFPEDFLPEKMMTTSPITVDDYRRGILDLVGISKYQRGYYFADAMLYKQEDEERFSTYYDQQNRQFVFEKEASQLPVNYTKLYLNGSYSVTARRSHLPLINPLTLAQKALENYLEENRNLCEVFRDISIADNLSDLNLTIKIEINDATADVNDYCAELFIALNNAVLLPLKRESHISLSYGDYTGPKAEHGWIADLPDSGWGADAEGKKLSVGQFLQAIASINVATTVSYISLENDGTIILIKPQRADTTFILWSANSDMDTRVRAMLQHVSFYRNESKLSVDTDGVVERVMSMSQLTVTDSTPSSGVKTGRYRNLTRYTPASSLLPALYKLQSWDKPEIITQLQRFMHGFEQELASRCAGLESLCRQLQFCTLVEGKDNTAFGSQWPYAEDTPYNHVFSDDEKNSLRDGDIINQKSPVAELQLARYLLDYFGVESTDLRGDSKEQTEEFLNISRKMIQQMPDVGYNRTTARATSVSSLQRRIAAQLGFGVDLFGENPDISQLPFYIVEHPLLLPDSPKADVSTQIEIKSARMVEINGKDLLLLEAVSSVKDTLTLKNMIDLSYPSLTPPESEGSEDITVQISSLLVVLKGSDLNTIPAHNGSEATEDKDACFFLSPAKFRTLRQRMERVLASAGNGLTFNPSNVWLRDMSYELNSQLAETITRAEGVTTNTWRIKTSSDQPWPGILQVGNKLVFNQIYSGSPADGETYAMPSDAITARVTQVDSISGSAEIQVEDGNLDPISKRYRWYIDPDSNKLLKLDRFSLTLSIVFPRSLIGDEDELTSNKNKENEENRIKRIVQAELPAHIQCRIHWLSRDQLSTFGSTYSAWHINNYGIGEHTLALLRMLSIGMLGDLLEGISEMMIPSLDDEENLKQFGLIENYDNWEVEEKTKWRSLIDNRGLLFIAPDD